MKREYRLPILGVVNWTVVLMIAIGWISVATALSI